MAADQVAQELQDKLSTQPSAEGGESSTVDGSSAGGGKSKNQLKKEAKVRCLRWSSPSPSRRASPPPPLARARALPCSPPRRSSFLTPHPSTLTPTHPTPRPPSHSQAAEKAAREAEKAAAAAQRGVKQAAPTSADPDDPLREKYGDPALVQSAGPPQGSGRVWTSIEDLTPALLDGLDADAQAQGKPVLVRARLANVRAKGKSAFLVLRQRTATVQAIMFADDQTVSKGMVKYASAIPKESIVDIEALLVKAKEPIASCTQADVELKVRGVWAISRAAGALPFELVDASRSDAEVAAAAEKGELLAKVEQNVRLDNRALDLRTPASQAIFRVQSAVCQSFRSTMLALGFQEVHTPKLISGASEGGAAVFAADYMGRPACLAQSPQLYKQMAIVADFDRVFEIGPVFRAENSFTHRHLCEFTGLDFEMAIKEHYSEVMVVIERIFMDMFKWLEDKCGRDLATIAGQYPFEPIVAKPCRLTFEGEGPVLGTRAAGPRGRQRRFFSRSRPPPLLPPLLHPHTNTDPNNNNNRGHPDAARERLPGRRPFGRPQHRAGARSWERGEKKVRHRLFHPLPFPFGCEAILHHACPRSSGLQQLFRRLHSRRGDHLGRAARARRRPADG
jgi:aspartyl/asparaginyl-tRNA synthetase